MTLSNFNLCFKPPITLINSCIYDYFNLISDLKFKLLVYNYIKYLKKIILLFIIILINLKNLSSIKDARSQYQQKLSIFIVTIMHFNHGKLKG